MWNFKARVLLELGAELISSDAVALFELIKNGLDAGSTKVKIDISIAMQPSAAQEIRELYSDFPVQEWDADGFRQAVENRLAKSATDDQRAAFLADLGKLSTPETALKSLERALFKHNSIVVADTGKGMDAATLTSCYLTVGTPMRLHERRNAKADQKVPLGEKGIGRLAAMRLGHYVHVDTGVRGETQIYELVLDWRPAFADYDLDAVKLKFEPKLSEEKAKKKGDSGTAVRISDIQSDWDEGKIERLANAEFAKLADPFDNNFANQFLSIQFQGQKLSVIHAFQSSLLQHADATCTIEFRSNLGDKKGAALQVTTDYKQFRKTESVQHEGAHLQSAVSYEPKGKNRTRAKDKLADSDAVIAALKTLGDFSARFYWYNRGRIRRQNPELWQNLEPFVRTWSGGLLVYRDGYRVYPYGAPSDDWLDLDRKALASSAYKLNRAQIIGYLRISIRGNPKLVDQTNREGFRDSPEKEALRRLLRQAIISDCKTFLESVDKQLNRAGPEELEELNERVGNSYERAQQTLIGLQRRLPGESDIVVAVLAELKEVNDAWERAKEEISAQEVEIEQFIHLAGVGLMVELIAHELARSTDMALDILDRKNVATSPAKLLGLQAQLKTINRRVRILDELSIPGRQRKSEQNIGELAGLMRELYAFKAERHGVTVSVVKKGRGGFVRRVEKGQILQILDNLLSNSIYWLNRRLNRKEDPQIVIEVDTDTASIQVLDNGPGIHTSIGNRVFDAFYTTKPSGEGRGLGLYIAKRLASDNDAELSLIQMSDDHYRGFELSFKGSQPK